MPRGKPLTRAERMIIYCAGMAEMPHDELNEIMHEIGKPDVADGTYGPAIRAAPKYRAQPGFLLRQIRSPKPFSRIDENE